MDVNDHYCQTTDHKTEVPRDLSRLSNAVSGKWLGGDAGPDLPDSRTYFLYNNCAKTFFRAAKNTFGCVLHFIKMFVKRVLDQSSGSYRRFWLQRAELQLSPGNHSNNNKS